MVAPLNEQSPTVVIPEREALRRAKPRDVDDVVEVQALLALDVEADPVAEVGEPVAEAGVDRVLEM